MKLISTDSINKDNLATSVLLGAIFALIAAAIFSTSVAEATSTSAKPAPMIETIVVTATRLQ